MRAKCETLGINSFRYFAECLGLQRRASEIDFYPPSDNAEVSELIELIKEVRVQMIGPIRQEILSGVKSQPQFQKLLDHLRAFPDTDIKTPDYELAAEFFNLCRAKGI